MDGAPIFREDWVKPATGPSGTKAQTILVTMDLRAEARTLQTGDLVMGKNERFMLSHPCHGDAMSWMGHPLFVRIGAAFGCFACGGFQFLRG